MPTSGKSPEQDPVESIMASLFELDARELSAAFERACTDHPEHADEMRRRMHAVRFVFDQPRPQQPDFPERLGDFRLIERLGGGGMGVVYRAEQVSLGREVALKLVRPELLYFPGARERFRRETEAVARLQHPGIVAIHTVGEENGVPFFAMELLRGRSLATVLTSLSDRAPEALDGSALGLGGSWVDACVELVRQLAEAVQHAHDRGILHRDVKPSNAMLLPDGRVTLLDFGLTSFARQKPDERMTASGTPLGTLAYMSPEQLKTSGELDVRTDVYSLGVTLYELLTLQLPYREDSPVDLQSRIVGGAPDSIRSRNRRVARDVETVCLHAMEARPQDRYPTAAGLARDLANVNARRPIDARPPGAPTRAVRWIQRHPATAAASALAFLLVIGLPTGLYLQQRAHNVELQDSLARERAARQLAAEEAEVASRVTDFVDELFQYASPERSLGEDVSVSFILDQGARRIEQELQTQPQVRARLLQTLGLAYDWLGIDDKAERLLREAFDLKLRLEGPDTASAIYLRVNLARTVAELGRFTEAERLLAEALDGQEGEDDETRIARATILSDHGYVLSDLGRMAEAEAELLRALEIQRSTAGGRHFGTANSSRTLAAFYANSLRPAAARAYFLESLELYEEILPGQHPHILGLKANLARNLQELGEIEAAEQVAEQTLAGARRVYGNDHANVSRHLLGLASIQDAQGKDEQAGALLRDALAIAENAPSPEPTTIAWILNDLGTRQLDRGNYQEAEQLQRRALALEQRVHTEGDPRVAIYMANLANVLSYAGKLEEAETLAQNSVAMSQRLGIGTAPGLATLAWVLILRGQLDQAVDTARRGLDGLGEVADRAGIQGSLHLKLSFVHNQRREGELAEQEARAALELESRDRPYRAMANYHLGWARELQQDPEGAREHWVASIEMYRRLFPEGHPDAMYPLNHHGGELLRAGQAEEGLPYLEEAVGIARRAPPGPYWTSVVLSNTAVAKLNLGDHSGSEKLLLEVYDLTAGPALADFHTATADQLVKLYEAWGKPELATRYRR